MVRAFIRAPAAPLIECAHGPGERREMIDQTKPQKWTVQGKVTEDTGMVADMWIEVQASTLETALEIVRRTYPRIVFDEAKREDERPARKMECPSCEATFEV